MPSFCLSVLKKLPFFMLLYSIVSAAHPLPLPHPSLAKMLKVTTPAVVNIAVEKIIPPDVNDQHKDHNTSSSFPQPTRIIGVGSGVIVNAQSGYIITNAHVISDEAMMVVTLKNGAHYPAKLIAKNDYFDLAVIQIDAKGLLAMPFGNSDQLQVGDFVVAIGSPFNLNQTVTSGIVSALNQQVTTGSVVHNFIQTDAPINLGNSGGSLIDFSGHLVGINTAIVTPDKSNSGIGLAIPSNIVKQVYQQLIQYGGNKPSILGVIVQNVTPPLSRAFKIHRQHGALITKVVPDSPAADAGLAVGDIILSVNQVTIEDDLALHDQLQLTRPGTKVMLKILRHHQIQTVTAIPKEKIQARPDPIPFLNGVRLQAVNLLEPDGTPLSGALVLNVANSSAAAIASLYPGDVILSVNGQPTPTIHRLIQILTQRQQAQRLLIKIARHEQRLFLVIKNSKATRTES